MSVPLIEVDLNIVKSRFAELFLGKQFHFNAVLNTCVTMVSEEVKRQILLFHHFYEVF